MRRLSSSEFSPYKSSISTPKDSTLKPQDKGIPPFKTRAVESNPLHFRKRSSFNAIQHRIRTKSDPKHRSQETSVANVVDQAVDIILTRQETRKDAAFNQTYG